MPKSANKVLIVDDSAIMRSLLRRLVESDPRFEVVGTACNAYEAKAKISELKPDVLTLDVEMPGVDGLAFLKELMASTPMPVVMVSSLTERGAQTGLEALRLGAIECVAKPTLLNNTSLSRQTTEILTKLSIATRAKVRPLTSFPKPAPMPTKSTDLDASVLTNCIIAMGASTGGTEALRRIVSQLTRPVPPIVITQHIPATFSSAFARRLDEICSLEVREATTPQNLVPNRVYIAPGDRHLLLSKNNAGRLFCSPNQGPEVNHVRPSVDVMFRSLASLSLANVLALLLTGMGNDGAQGLLELRRSGARTFAQDESSSVIWGMPGTAVEMGAAETVLPLSRIPYSIGQWVRTREGKSMERKSA